MKTVVVIPAFNESRHIRTIIEAIPLSIQDIIVVDDGSTDNTAEVVKSITDERIQLISHRENLGVGAAMCTGYRHALKINADIIVKIDGDGQMDPNEIEKIVLPVENGGADYSKGCRFYDMQNLQQMPKIRLIGNLILSFMTKFVSGYWQIFDPTSGFTAIHKRVLSRLNLSDLAKGYFFETDMLIKLYFLQARVVDVNISTRYGSEESHLSIRKVVTTFPYYFFKALIRRIVWRYFLIDFDAVSLFISLGLPLLIFGVNFGLYHWIKGIINNTLTPLGTIMIAVLSIFIGFELLLQALVLDIINAPKGNKYSNS